MVLYNPRSVEEYQSEYIRALADAGSGLAFDVTQGSVLYALARSSAAVAATQGVDLKRLAESITLSKAKGIDLDAYSSYGISRIAAAKATGSILAISNTTRSETIAPDTVLTEPQTAIQYRTTNTAPVRVGYLESLIPVQSIESTTAANLAAGTRLYSSRHSSIQFIIGNSHTPDNAYYGDLTGGRARESDDSYRQRIADWLSSRSTTARNNIMQRVLSFPGVTNAYTRTKAGGVLEIWVDMGLPVGQRMNTQQQLELTQWLRPVVSEGIFITIGDIVRKYVDLRFDVKPFFNANLDLLSTRIRDLCAAYFNQQYLNQDFQSAPLLTLLKPLAPQITLADPKSDVYVGVEERAMLGNVEVNYQIY
jgi:hypothetical protein